MPNNTWRISADVPHATRSLLLRMHPPKFARVYVHSLTWAYGVDDSFEFPEQMQDCMLWGYHEGRGTQALLARLSGFSYRPDNKPLFLTLSCQEGVEPAQAGEIDMALVRKINPVVFSTRLIRRPLWKQSPAANPNRHAAA